MNTRQKFRSYRDYLLDAGTTDPEDESLAGSEGLMALTSPSVSSPRQRGVRANRTTATATNVLSRNDVVPIAVKEKDGSDSDDDKNNNDNSQQRPSGRNAQTQAQRAGLGDRGKGPLSPFSPVLLQAINRRQKRQRNQLASSSLLPGTDRSVHVREDCDDGDGDDYGEHSDQHHRQDDNGQWFVSLFSCRKVSVVVLVTNVKSKKNRFGFLRNTTKLRIEQPSPRGNGAAATDEGDHDDERTCLFPLPPQDSKDTTLDARNALVVVNPKAFGKYIPSNITMETSKIVAQLAHIPSEDWTRIYHVQHVIWPTRTRTPTPLSQASTVSSSSTMPTAGSPTNQTQDDPVLSLLIAAAVNDVMMKNSISRRIFLALGHAGKTEILFGSVVSPMAKPELVVQTTTADLSPDQVMERYGLLGCTVTAIIARHPAALTLSVLEVADEQSLYDLLATRPFNPDATKRVTLRHSTTIPPNTTSAATTVASSLSSSSRNPESQGSGAIIEGLSAASIDSLKTLGQCMRRAFAAARHQKRKTTRGTIVVTLQIYANLQDDRFTVVQFVDVGVVHNDHMPAFFRRNAALRKAEWALGGVLRGMLVKEAGNDTMIPFRESMLTKVLQRQMDHPDSRTIVLTNVSSNADAYEDTLQTMRYVSRLLLKPGQTPQSPFDLADVNTSQMTRKPVIRAVASPSKKSSLNRLASKTQAIPKEFLRHMLSDPRQRLAKLVPPKSPVKVPVTLSPDRQYVPTQYLSPNSAGRQSKGDVFQDSWGISNGDTPFSDTSSEYIPTQYLQDPGSLLISPENDEVYRIEKMTDDGSFANNNEEDETVDEEEVMFDYPSPDKDNELTEIVLLDDEQDRVPEMRTRSHAIQIEHTGEAGLPTPLMHNTAKGRGFSAPDPPEGHGGTKPLTLHVPSEIDRVLDEPSPLTADTLDRRHWSDKDNSCDVLADPASGLPKVESYDNNEVKLSTYPTSTWITMSNISPIRLNTVQLLETATNGNTNGAKCDDGFMFGSVKTSANGTYSKAIPDSSVSILEESTKEPCVANTGKKSALESDILQSTAISEHSPSSMGQHVKTNVESRRSLKIYVPSSTESDETVDYQYQKEMDDLSFELFYTKSPSEHHIIRDHGDLIEDSFPSRSGMKSKPLSPQCPSIGSKSNPQKSPGGTASVTKPRNASTTLSKEELETLVLARRMMEARIKSPDKGSNTSICRSSFSKQSDPHVSSDLSTTMIIDSDRNVSTTQSASRTMPINSDATIALDQSIRESQNLANSTKSSELKGAEDKVPIRNFTELTNDDVKSETSSLGQTSPEAHSSRYLPLRTGRESTKSSHLETGLLGPDIALSQPNEQGPCKANVSSRYTEVDGNLKVPSELLDNDVPVKNHLNSKIDTMENLRKYMNEFRGNLDSYRMVREELDQQIHKLRKDHASSIAEKEDEIARLNGRLQKAEHDKNELLRIAEEAISTQAELEVKVTELEEILAEHESQSISVKDQESSLRAELSALYTEVEIYKKEITESDKKLLAMHRDLQQSERQQSRIFDEKAKLQTEVNRLAEKFDEESVRSDDKLVTLENQCYHLRRELRISKEANEALRSEYAEKEKSCMSLEHQMSLTGLKLMTANQHIAEVEKELEETRKELDLRILDVQTLAASLKKVLKEKEYAELIQSKLKNFEDELEGLVAKLRQARFDDRQLLENVIRENEGQARVVKDLQTCHDQDKRFIESLERENRTLKKIVRELRASLGDYREHDSMSLDRDRSLYCAGRTPRDDHTYFYSVDERQQSFDLNDILKGRPSGLSVMSEGFEGKRIKGFSQRELGGRGLGRNASPHIYANDDSSLPIQDGSNSGILSQVAMRAEEVAAYMAVSAKDSIERSKDEAKRSTSETLRLTHELKMANIGKEAELQVLRLENKQLEKRLEEIMSSSLMSNRKQFKA